MTSRIGGFSLYALASTGLVGTVCWQAFTQRRYFYPTVIYLTSSKLSLLVLGNQALVLTLLFGAMCKRFFFGRLRDAEVEALYDRAWYAITETCLAMTIFREEFNARFVAMFTALLFLKIFHWLMQDRVAYMEQSPAVPYATHARMLVLMGILLALDGAFLHHAVHTTLKYGPSVLLLFAFEYLILASTVCATFSKYALHVNDTRLGGRWDSKGVYLFYLELITDLFHMLVYLAFFVLICTHYGLPLHIMRDLYLTIRSFRQRVADFIRYRRITHNMQDRFPDATEEDLDRTDRICIICRETMDTGKKLACGHIFHFHCLRSWLERQQTCPTCRAPIEAPDQNANAAAAAANRAANPDANNNGAAAAANANANAGNNAAAAAANLPPGLEAYMQQLQAAARAAQANSAPTVPGAAGVAAAGAAGVGVPAVGGGGAGGGAGAAVAAPGGGMPGGGHFFGPGGQALPQVPAMAQPGLQQLPGYAGAMPGTPGGLMPGTPAALPGTPAAGTMPFAGSPFATPGAAPAAFGIGATPPPYAASPYAASPYAAFPYAASPYAAYGAMTPGGFGGLGGWALPPQPVPAGVFPPNAAPPGTVPALFASPYLLPSALQLPLTPGGSAEPPGATSTAAYLQAQIQWLNGVLASLTPPASAAFAAAATPTVTTPGPTSGGSAAVPPPSLAPSSLGGLTVASSTPAAATPAAATPSPTPTASAASPGYTPGVPTSYNPATAQFGGCSCCPSVTQPSSVGAGSSSACVSCQPSSDGAGALSSAPSAAAGPSEAPSTPSGAAADGTPAATDGEPSSPESSEREMLRRRRLERLETPPRDESSN